MENAKENFRGSLYLWINTAFVDNTEDTLASFLKCQKALDDLIALRISWYEYLEILSAAGVDMDEYIDTAFYNFVACDFLVNQ